MKLIQPEPFTLRMLGDGDRGHSLVIPLPKDRALRVGFRWRSWCKLGPRRYSLIAAPGFVKGWADVFGESEDEAKASIRESGIAIEGDLRAVEQ